MFNAYLWGDTTQAKHIHWTSWDKFCFPKNEGDLGCKSIKEISLAFECKMWWNFRKQKSLWSWVMKSKYCNGGQHETLVQVRYNDSPIWKRMIQVREYVEPHFFWKVSIGRINFERDQRLRSGVIVGRPLPNSTCTNHVMNYETDIGIDCDCIKLSKVLPYDIIQ